MADALREHKIRCDTYISWRSNVNVSNGAGGWAANVRKNGSEEMASWKLGQAVSESIARTPGEHERRSEVARRGLTRFSMSDEGRKLSSETAKRTSRRPDVIENRSKNLQRWRDENPEDFYQKCIVAMHNTFQSKPQRLLFEECKKLDAAFSHNQRLYDVRFSTISHRRQIDILHREKMIIVEFDGPYHFKKVKKDCDPLDVKRKDDELNSVLSSSGWAVVRISYDCYDHRSGGSFGQGCLEKIKELLNDHRPGVYMIGGMYV